MTYPSSQPPVNTRRCIRPVAIIKLALSYLKLQAFRSAMRCKIYVLYIIKLVLSLYEVDFFPVFKKYPYVLSVFSV